MMVTGINAINFIGIAALGTITIMRIAVKGILLLWGMKRR